MSNGIVLMTDFGIRDGAVAAMKGVIRSTWSGIPFIDDLSHGVEMGDVVEGAFLLGVNYSYYPLGTVFVAVVDPGVGTNRKAILVKTEGGYTFVGPNNGVLNEVIRREHEAGRRILSVVELTNERFFHHPVSAVFHGRDIFASVAAYAATMGTMEYFGPALQVKDLLSDSIGVVQVLADTILGKVIFQDDFGNCVVSVREQDLEDLPAGDLRISLGERTARFVRTFDDGEGGELLALFGGDFPPFMTLAVNMASAAERFRIKKGDTVTVKRSAAT
ncbi:MAG: SAM-dependent chlorinase/fluorinase [bacterium]|nr:SAM-dependent chlorinase/fluorinase [bacterium]